MKRREFVESLSLGCATLALGGCASQVTHAVTPVEGVVRLRMADLPQLAKPGGSIRIQAAGRPESIYVLRGDDENGLAVVTALSPICTHRGCTVETQGAVLICPCHGSTYTRSGSVLRGPADRPLPAYKTSVASDGTIEIQLGGVR